MYETFMHTLRTFFGSGVMLKSLVVAVGLTIPVLAAYCTPAFRELWNGWRVRGGWRGSITGTLTGIFKFCLVFVIARAGITSLTYQAQIFGQEHGRVTEKNRSAVLMKWGYPHEQRELSVNHTRKREWITRQLQPQGKDARIVTESYWKDLEKPVRAINGKMPSVVSVSETLKDVSVMQKSVMSADVSIKVRNNPRTLGNANYAGYNDAWRLRYVVANRSKWTTTAHLSFPLPAGTGLFDEMFLKIDGVDAMDSTRSHGTSLAWDIKDMAPGATNVIEIGYRSRGLEHLRYIPKRMSRTGHYRVSMTVDGIPTDKLDYPIGSMPPAEKLTDISGSPYTLTWKLDNALTSYDIGIKLPEAEQPEFHFARLLEEAPIGLVLLLVVLIIPRLILGEPVNPAIAFLLGLGYCLHYTFMGRLAAMMPGFSGPFIISALIMILIIGWFRMKGNGRRVLRALDPAGFAGSIILYPLAVVNADRTALWMQFFYVGILILCVSLLVKQRRSGRP